MRCNMMILTENGIYVGEIVVAESELRSLEVVYSRPPCEGQGKCRKRERERE